MIGDLLTRRAPGGPAVREPTLLALGLAAVGLVAVAGLCVVGILAFAALGYGRWVFAAVAMLLALLVLGPRLLPGPRARPATGRQACLQRTLALGRLLLGGLLACWLGLLAWSEVSRGGPAPPPRAEADLVRVLTWNIHCGQDEGLPWERFDWPARKRALAVALDEARPDILCVQEARPVQVEFLEEVLPGHGRVGVGRDGGAAGEHCAVYFRKDRFEEVDSGTFWLEEPTAEPRPGSALGVKRICTWVRLRDVRTGRVLRVYNTHLYLTEAPRVEAARLILEHIAAGDPADLVILTADFNGPPSAPSRQLFTRAGLRDSAELAGQRLGARTFQLYGVPVRSLDSILVGPGWRVQRRLILDVKPGNTFPSDHFGVLADLECGK